MKSVDSQQQTLDLLLVRELLKSAKVFGGTGAHAGLAQDAFVDVIAEAVVHASHPTAPHGSRGPSSSSSSSSSSSGHQPALPALLPVPSSALGAVVAGPARVSSPFGHRVDPITGKEAGHHGLDIAAPEGTPISSLGWGVGVLAGGGGGYGLVVDVKGDDGRVIRYAHAHELSVKVGQRVETGHQIGTVGSTGRSTGPHLHLEVRVDGVAEDPTTALLTAFARRRQAP